MRLHTCHVLAILTIVSFSATPIIAAADPSAALNGVWRLVALESEGQTRELDDDVRWVIKEGKAYFGGEPLAALVIYAASTPPGIDISFYEPKTEYEGIFALDKDGLRICLNTRTTGPKDRPFDFATKDKTNLRVLKFERLAPADGGPGPVKGYVGMALAVDNETVVIQGVLENSPAQKAGLRAGDAIMSLNGERTSQLEETVAVVRRQAPGSELKIRVLREGKEKQIDVRVAVFPFSLLGLLG